MAQTKIYPATQTQANTIINKIDAVDAKIVTPNYQAKVVTPTTAQQLVEPDSGYGALSSVTVNAVTAAIDPNIKPENIANHKSILDVFGTNGVEVEQFILRSSNRNPFDLTLSGNIPSYACYGQAKLNNIEIENCNSIESNAFNGAGLETAIIRGNTVIGGRAFSGSKFKKIIARGNISLETSAFWPSPLLQFVDFRNAYAFGNTSLRGCTELSLIDLTSVTTVPQLGNLVFYETNSYWIAVVADDTMKTAFQSATNWSEYASHFRTIAEVEQETGMSYDDYYYQCFGHARNEVAQ